MKKFFIVWVLVIALIFSITLSSCKNNESSKYNVVDTLYITWTGDDTILQEAWDDFCELNTKDNQSKYYNRKIKLIIETVEFFVGDENWPDESADIICAEDSYLHTYGKKDLLLDLDEFDIGKSIDEKFSDNSKELGIYKSKRFGLPLSLSTELQYCDENVLASKDLTIPKTYDEMLEIGQTFLEDDKGIYHKGWTFPNVLISMIWSLGSELMNEDETEVIFNQPDTGVKAFEIINKLKNDNMLKMDLQKDCIFTISPNVILEEKYFSSYVQMPSLKENIPGYSVKDSIVLMVRKNSVNKELACDFIKFLAFDKSTTQNKMYSHLLMGRNESTVVFSNGISPLKEVQEELYQNNQLAKIYIDQLNNAKQIPFAMREHYYEIMMNEIEQMLIGTRTPERAVQIITKSINAKLERQN